MLVAACLSASAFLVLGSGAGWAAGAVGDEAWAVEAGSHAGWSASPCWASNSERVSQVMRNRPLSPHVEPQEFWQRIVLLRRSTPTARYSCPPSTWPVGCTRPAVLGRIMSVVDVHRSPPAWWGRSWLVPAPPWSGASPERRFRPRAARLAWVAVRGAGRCRWPAPAGCAGLAWPLGSAGARGGVCVPAASREGWAAPRALTWLAQRLVGEPCWAG